MALDDGMVHEIDLDPFLGLSEEQFDLELERDDPALRTLLQAATEPPADLADRMNSRTQEALLKRKIGGALFGLATLGLPTAKHLLMDAPDERQD